MNRKYRREFSKEEVTQVIEKRKIGVLGAGRGAGASFVASSLALRMAAQHKGAVAYVELENLAEGKTWIYDAVGMERRMGGKRFRRFHDLVRHRRYIRGERNQDRGVNWAMTAPQDRSHRLTGLEKTRLINNIAGDVIVCDLGMHCDADLLEEMDVLFCVVDPKPSRLLDASAAFREMKRMENSGRRLFWIINRMNGGVSRRIFQEHTRIRGGRVLPLMKEHHFYAAEYNCRFPLEQREIQKITAPHFDAMVQNIFQ